MNKKKMIKTENTGIHDGFDNSFSYGTIGKIKTAKNLMSTLSKFPQNMKIFGQFDNVLYLIYGISCDEKDGICINLIKK